jgi:transcription elongation factor GreA
VAKEVVLTAEGYRELKERLDFLTTERRREIAELEEQLRDAKVIEKGDQPRGEVAIGSTVTLKGPRNSERKFKLVGSAEADPDQNRYSNESPIGRAVLGGKKGDKVDVITPKGIVKYEITAISRV